MQQARPNHRGEGETGDNITWRTLVMSVQKNEALAISALQTLRAAGYDVLVFGAEMGWVVRLCENGEEKIKVMDMDLLCAVERALSSLSISI